jgi:uncharacterized alkaline shock family protein YloU
VKTGVNDQTSRNDDLALARVIADAVAAVPGVASLSPGRFGAAATLGANSKVQGVRIERSEGPVTAHIHVIAEYRPDESLHDLAQRIRINAQRAAGVSIGRIDVTVQDLFLPEQEGP